MAGEIQLNLTSFASESSGTITINNATIGSAVAMAANQACVKTAINASGSAPIYACRAWVNFDGTGTVAIRDSGNVSSITDNGTGDYTVNFTTAMPDANYAVNCTRAQGQNASYAFICCPRYPTSTYTTASSFRFASTVTNSGATNGSYQDEAFLTVSIFR
jgi:hypothetical protein